MIFKLVIIGLTSLCIYNLNPKVMVIDKKQFKLHVIRGNDTCFTAGVATGKNPGNKMEDGDNKTPEGTFKINEIYDSTNWTIDYDDGKGKRKGMYGPYFFRLKVPGFTHIGIHGTCYPWSIGRRASGGCVRLRNEDVVKLRDHVYVGMKVTILPDS